MDTSLQALLDCSYGSAGFRLEEYEYEDEPQVTSGTGRTGTKITITGVGIVEAATPENLAAAVAAMQATLDRSGQDLIIKHAGTIETQLLAAWCNDGGPHCKFTQQKDPPNALARRFEIEITGYQIYSPTSTKGGGAANVYKVKTDDQPDDLCIYTRSGTISGANAQAAFDAMADQLNTTYPANRYIMDLTSTISSYAIDGATTSLEYEVRIQQLAGVLPATPNNDTAVEGEYTVSTDRDEQMRLTTVYKHDYVLERGSDALALEKIIRPGKNAGTILRQSVSITSITQIKLSASYTVLSGGNGNDLMDWHQSMKIKRAADSRTYEEHTFIGADPIAVLAKKGFSTLTQSGSATCVGRFLKAPQPMSVFNMGQPPEITYDDSNGVEKKTSWTYVMFFDERETPGGPDSIDPSKLARPTDPENSPGFWGPKPPVNG